MSSKRKYGDLEDTCNKAIIQPNISRDSSGNQPRKGTVQEGFSWWTALMYDMPIKMTKLHLVQKGQGQISTDQNHS